VKNTAGNVNRHLPDADTNVSVCLSVTGDTMNTFLNDNFQLILKEIGQPSYKALGMAVHQIMVAITNKVPYDELFTDVN
jgi:hypothetical protein